MQIISWNFFYELLIKSILLKWQKWKLKESNIKNRSVKEPKDNLKIQHCISVPFFLSIELRKGFRSIIEMPSLDINSFGYMVSRWSEKCIINKIWDEDQYQNACHYKSWRWYFHRKVSNSTKKSKFGQEFYRLNWTLPYSVRTLFHFIRFLFQFFLCEFRFSYEQFQ